MASVDLNVLLVCKFVLSVTIVIVIAVFSFHAASRLKNDNSRNETTGLPTETELLCFRYAAIITSCTYVGGGVLGLASVHVHNARNGGWWYSEEFFVFTLIEFILLSITQFALPVANQRLVYATQCLPEVLLSVSLVLGSLKDDRKDRDVLSQTLRTLEILSVSVQLLRTGCCFIGILLVAKQLVRQSSATHDQPTEEAPLLEQAHHQTDPQWNTQSVRDQWNRCLTLIPYLLPSSERKLYLKIVACVLTVAYQRVINLALPLALKSVFDGLDHPSGDVHERILLYVLLQYLQSIAHALETAVWNTLSRQASRTLLVKGFRHILSLGLGFIIQEKRGELSSAHGKAASISALVQTVLIDIPSIIFDLTTISILFFVYFKASFALIMVSMSLYYLEVSRVLLARRRQIIQEAIDMTRLAEGVKEDSLACYVAVECHDGAEWEEKRYENLIYAANTHESRADRSQLHMTCTQALVLRLGIGLMILITASRVLSGAANKGDLILVLTCAQQIQQPLDQLSGTAKVVQKMFANAERMLAVLLEKPRVCDSVEAQPIENLTGDIELHNVWFAHRQCEPMLRGVSFRCLPGTTTAIVGETGCGKSTIFNLLFRHFDIQDGLIKFDGRSSSAITIKALRKHIGMVPQDPDLFHESVVYNLKYANQDATDEQVKNACQRALIFDKIQGFPLKFNTIVGNSGQRLSGGEKQRIAIARLFLMRPSIILLDEATSALDTATEQGIRKELRRFFIDRTVIMIAHRLSTVMNVDQILVMQKGRIVERGTHQQLLMQNGVYASMWKSQASQEL